MNKTSSTSAQWMTLPSSSSSSSLSDVVRDEVEGNENDEVTTRMEALIRATRISIPFTLIFYSYALFFYTATLFIPLSVHPACRHSHPSPASAYFPVYSVGFFTSNL